jgi:hypothetical protein
MKDKNGVEVGPRPDWGNWRAKRDAAIRKPKRSRAKAVALLEEQNRVARGVPASLEDAIADNDREIEQEQGQ